MGAMAYITDEMLALLPENEQALYANIPAWITTAFVIAVFGRALACILLFMRKKMASVLFIISF